MTFDIIELKPGELESFSTIQVQLLRTAQKKKNELYRKMKSDLAMFKLMIYGNGLMASTLYKNKQTELQEEYEYQVAILKEQLLYSLSINEPYPDEKDLESVGYIVDYSLSYTDRYAIVREYYLAIEDGSLRMQLYTNDEVAKRYLGSYYSVLYNVLYNYSR